MRTDNWGVFTAEGCIEDGLTQEQAERTADQERAEDDTVYAAEICPEHEEQPRATCEECATDTEDDDTEDDDTEDDDTEDDDTEEV